MFNRKKIEKLVTSLALNIGLKFFSSLIFLTVMYYKQWFQGTIIVLVFLFLYFLYTYLYSRFDKNI